jgi:hypothetical protein
VVVGSAEAADRVAFVSVVLLLGVPRCRPPRRSPVSIPAASLVFRYFRYSAGEPEQVRTVSPTKYGTSIRPRPVFAGYELESTIGELAKFFDHHVGGI